MSEIVLAFTPSKDIKDWQLRSDGKQWWYEQVVRFYCQEHQEIGDAGGFANCSVRNIGREPYYNLKTKRIVEPPRVYISHYPKKGEWEHLKTIDDVENSRLCQESRDYIKDSERLTS